MLLRLVSFLWIFFSTITAFSQPCSLTDGRNCKCGDSLLNYCDLLPDIRLTPQSLTDSGGYTEYPPVNAAENYFSQGKDDGRLRMNIATPNTGAGVLHVLGSGLFSCGDDTITGYPGPCSDGFPSRQLLYQRIYQKNGDSIRYYDRPAGFSDYVSYASKTLITNWGHYTLRIKTPWENDPVKWPVVSERWKTGSCLMDNSTCSGHPGYCRDKNDSILLDTDFPNYGMGVFSACALNEQGISPGFADIYEQWMYGMWIDIPAGTCNGDYYLVIEIDPEDRFLEEDETNNLMTVPVKLSRQVAPANQKPVISSSCLPLICKGDSMFLKADAGYSWLWSTGDTTQTIWVKQAGDFWVTVSSPCGTAVSDSFRVKETDPPDPPQVAGDTVCIGDSATLASANGDTLDWFTNSAGGTPVYSGNVFRTPPVVTSATWYAARKNVSVDTLLHAGRMDTSGNGKYFAGGAFVSFDIHTPVVIEAVTVYAKDSGYNVLKFRNQDGDEITSRFVSFGKGKSRIPLNLYVKPGSGYNFFLSGTDDSLYGDSANVWYPYVQPGVISLYSSSAGKDKYLYLYDWEIKVLPRSCSSLRTLVTVKADSSCFVSVNNLSGSPQNHVTISPNPVQKYTWIELTNPKKSKIKNWRLFDVSGRELKNGENLFSPVFRFDREGILPGIYFIVITDSEESVFPVKLVIQ